MADRLGDSVGLDGANDPADVRRVQALLNHYAGRLGMPPMTVNGVFGPGLDVAIRRYQRAILGFRAPDGLIEANGRTFQMLSVGSAAIVAGGKIASARRSGQLSGAAWFHAHQAEFPNSSAVADLQSGFRAHVEDFLRALAKAGAHVHVSSTLRNPTRAYLMHWSFKVASGAVDPGAVPSDPKAGILWDHGDLAASRKAAQEMVALFGIKYAPSLTSNHIHGTAIDMTITWSGPITVADAHGTTIVIDRPRNGAANGGLHAVGGTYRVYKLLVDAPHWSADGH